MKFCNIGKAISATGFLMDRRLMAVAAAIALVVWRLMTRKLEDVELLDALRERTRIKFLSDKGARRSHASNSNRVFQFPSRYARQLDAKVAIACNATSSRLSSGREVGCVRPHRFN